MRITEVQCISFSIVLYLKAISRETNAIYGCIRAIGMIWIIFLFVDLFLMAFKVILVAVT